MNHSILQGKRGIIFGALDEQSIAWEVALAAKKAGAIFTLTNAPVAIRMGKTKALAEICECELIPADATNLEDIKTLLEQSAQILGGQIDFVLHAVGMSPNVRKKKSYTDIVYNYFEKTLDISAISFHKFLQSAWKMDALAPQASVIALSYIAAQKAIPGYGDMSDAKSTLESIARNFGYYYGKRNGVRINTISQSPTLTTAGKGIEGFNKFYDYASNLSPLGNADASSCADYCVMMFSDYTKMVTMQNLYHDGGFSQTGMSEDILSTE
ncbi:MAG TPA: SDR family oxidoreductase [Chitinophagales bacterium]|nr:SDR family oxidoreductase [Chitinophagales bacterium]